MELWYPGQMARARKALVHWLPHIDIIIEVLDARIPESSRNPALDNLIRQKVRIVVLNKADLADDKCNNIWKEYLESEGWPVAVLDARSGKGINSLKKMIRRAREVRDKRVGKSLKIMVVGIPNVGKSTIINRLAGREAARTGDSPGITRGHQWIRLAPGLDLLDMPGLLWPRTGNRKTAIHLAAVGSLKEQVVDIEEVAQTLIEMITKEKPGSLQKLYGIKYINKSSLFLLKDIGKVRGHLITGGEINTRQAAEMVIRDFKRGKLGRHTLEFPEKEKIR